MVSYDGITTSNSQNIKTIRKNVGLMDKKEYLSGARLTSRQIVSSSQPEIPILQEIFSYLLTCS
jgi:hypothetical protein